MKRLSELVAGASKDIRIEGDAAISVSGVASDSRAVKPGMLFAAIKGVSQDGADYVADAVKAGATAVLAREGVAVPKGVTALYAADDRHAVAKVAAAYYAPQAQHVVAVTGTDGKTSTAEFFRQLIGLSGEKAASLGTMGLKVSGKVKLGAVPALNTSPDPILLHQTLAQLEEKECHYVALEASSHGLDQKRLDGVKLDAAAFTSFARDHMDYHKSEKAYFEAKMRLFGALLPKGGNAVVYDGLKYLDELKHVAKLRKLNLLTYGQKGDLLIRQLKRTAQGMEVRLNLAGQRVEATVPLIGDFQLLNILAATGLAHGCGKDMLTLVHNYSKLQPVRGRVEQAAVMDNGASVYVDYAHTPAALEKVLATLRHHTQGKLAVVFGCGGDRDKGKRPLMGKVASELADRVYLTDDNPRSEDGKEIRKAIKAGCSGEAKVRSIGDRKRAIKAALEELHGGDILLIAGKGHEDYQIIGDQRFDFDDVQVVKKLVG